jgi:hypothetical protein
MAKNRTYVYQVEEINEKFQKLMNAPNVLASLACNMVVGVKSVSRHVQLPAMSYGHMSGIMGTAQ